MSGFPSACATAPASSSSGTSRSPSATTRRATASSSPRSWRTICPPRPRASSFARDPETGFLAAFAIFPLATLSPAEFPDAFDKFAAFATALADRLDAERAGMSVTPEDEPPAEGETPAFSPGLISV